MKNLKRQQGPRKGSRGDGDDMLLHIKQVLRQLGLTATCQIGRVIRLAECW